MPVNGSRSAPAAARAILGEGWFEKLLRSIPMIIEIVKFIITKFQTEGGVTPTPPPGPGSGGPGPVPGGPIPQKTQKPLKGRALNERARELIAEYFAQQK